MKINKRQLNWVFILLLLTLTMLFINSIEYQYSESKYEGSKAISKTYTINWITYLTAILVVLSIPAYFIIKNKITNKL